MSDHISGPRALSDPIADITDVYAFPSPERPGRLVLVMNTLPFAKPWDALSDGLIYRFRLRPLTAGAPGDAAPFTAGDDEVVLDCVFSPHVHPNGPRRFEQEGTCTTPAGETVTLPRQRPGRRRGARCPGLRRRALGPVHHGRPRRVEDHRHGEAGVHRPVVDLPRRQGRPQPRRGARHRAARRRELVAVVAETLTRGVFNVRIERVGRPEVKNMMLAPKQFDPVNRDLEIRDLYNSEDAFQLADGYLGAYRARLNANLAFWDGLDGNADWAPREDGSHPLTELVLADYLVVDVTKPYVEQGSYLEIELAALRGEAHRTCGGRTLNDDVMDTIFTQLINAGNGPVIRDGVDRSTRPGTRTFPYLAEPNPDPPEPPEHH